MKNDVKSYIMLMSSMLVFGTIGIFRKYIPLSSALLACLRGIVGSLFLLAFVKIKGRKIVHHIGAKKLIALAVIGGAIGLNWILLFEAYNYTTVSVATLCYYMEPTFLILLSPLAFKEKLTAKKIICAVISLIGMVLISGILENDGSSEFDYRGILFGLGAAMLYTIIVIVNKKVQIEDAYEKTIIQLSGAAVVILPYVLLTEDLTGISLDLTAFIMLALICIVHTGIAYALYFGSMDKLKAQSIAVLSYIDPVSALILSAIFLNERMTVLGIIGAVCIIGAALLSEHAVKGKTLKK